MFTRKIQLPFLRISRRTMRHLKFHIDCLSSRLELLKSLLVLMKEVCRILISDVECLHFLLTHSTCRKQGIQDQLHHPLQLYEEIFCSEQLLVDVYSQVKAYCRLGFLECHRSENRCWCGVPVSKLSLFIGCILYLRITNGKTRLTALTRITLKLYRKIRSMLWRSFISVCDNIRSWDWAIEYLKNLSAFIE